MENINLFQTLVCPPELCHLGSTVSSWGSSSHQKLGSFLLSRSFPCTLRFKIPSLHVTYPSGMVSAHFLSYAPQLWGSRNTAVAYRSGPRPKKTSAPLVPQTRRLRVPDQCCAPCPAIDLLRSADDVSAHFAVPPAWLRAVLAEQLDTDHT